MLYELFFRLIKEFYLPIAQCCETNILQTLYNHDTEGHMQHVYYFILRVTWEHIAAVLSCMGRAAAQVVDVEVATLRYL